MWIVLAVWISLGLCEGQAYPTSGATVEGAVPLALPDLLPAYGAIRDALVRDDAAAVEQAARDLASRAATDPEVQALALSVARASDWAPRRLAFGELSRVLVGRLGLGGGPRVFVYFCPMVTDGYAYWVQSKRGIANPYMGVSMPACGSESTLKVAVRAAAPATEAH